MYFIVGQSWFYIDDFGVSLVTFDVQAVSVRTSRVSKYRVITYTYFSGEHVYVLLR